MYGGGRGWGDGGYEEGGGGGGYDFRHHDVISGLNKRIDSLEWLVRQQSERLERWIGTDERRGSRDHPTLTKSKAPVIVRAIDRKPSATFLYNIAEFMNAWSSKYTCLYFSKFECKFQRKQCHKAHVSASPQMVKNNLCTVVHANGDINSSGFFLGLVNSTKGHKCAKVVADMVDHIKRISL